MEKIATRFQFPQQREQQRSRGKLQNPLQDGLGTCWHALPGPHSHALQPPEDMCMLTGDEPGEPGHQGGGTHSGYEECRHTVAQRLQTVAE